MARHDIDDHVRGYQPYDDRIRPVVAFVAWLAVGTLVVLGIAKLAHDHLAAGIRERSRAIHPLAAEREEPPEPRLQATPALDLARARAKEDERLSTYGWIDRQAGVVHLPIERAMELVAREGLPARKEGGR
jgi:hypothetical protein